MTGPQVMVDAANIVAGGGVQVAASLLDELVQMRSRPDQVDRYAWLQQLQAQASPLVVDNLNCEEALEWVSVEERPTPWSRRRSVGGIDLVLEVFGPVYRAIPARRRITGFADGTSLLPEYAGVSGARASAKRTLRSRLSRRCFARADRIVVESPAVVGALRDRWGRDPAEVSVIPNTLNRVFAADATGPRRPDIPQDVATLCYVTRAYPHKNLGVLGSAAQILRTRWGIEVRYVLTLTAAEFSRLDQLTRVCSVNLGPLPIGQIPAVYRSCTGTVFTSLLESFSVSPLEAMACGSSLVASDRDFVRDVAGEAAFYVDPLSPISVAEGIRNMLQNGAERERRREIGFRKIERWPDAQARARAYAELVNAEL
jgi:glycosyltransferase involved in cell wall biosynthesis